MRAERLGLVLVSLLLFTPLGPVGADPFTHGGRYIAGTDAIVIWCSAEPHSLVPAWDPSTWILPNPFSGEPECAHAEVANEVAEAQDAPREEWGYGGFAWALPPSVLGSNVVIASEDDVFGGNAYLRGVASNSAGDDQVVEACGPVVLPVPDDTELHWQATPDDPLHLIWAYIPAAAVMDDLDVCFASTGRVWATWDA